VLNVMRLQTPESAILSAIIFNALSIIVLIPLALRGVKYRPQRAGSLLFRNLMIYGVIVPHRHQGDRHADHGDRHHLRRRSCGKNWVPPWL